MPRGNDKKQEKAGPSQRAGGYKIRTTNDLLLISMILDDNPYLRERVMALLEQHMGRRKLLKVGDEPK